MFLPLTKSVSLTETLDCGAWLGLLSDKVALNDFQMLETCLMEIEYSLFLSLDGWCPKSGLWGKLVTWAKTSVWLSWLMSNFWFLRKTHDLSKKPQGDCPVCMDRFNSVVPVLAGGSVFIFPLHIGLLFPGVLAVLTWILVFTFSVCMSVLWPMTYNLWPIYWGRYFKLLFV